MRYSSPTSDLPAIGLVVFLVPTTSTSVPIRIREMQLLSSAFGGARLRSPIMKWSTAVVPAVK
jgi:hypothetical protein